MSAIRLTLLGGFSAVGVNGNTISFPAKARALLAYLAFRPGTRHPRDKLATLLWESDDARARDSLRHVLGSLRDALKAEQTAGLAIVGGTIALDPASVTTDVAEFERLAGGATVEAWQAAGRLYAGNLLDGLAVDAPPFEEWLRHERERLRELAADTLARMLAHQMSLPPAVGAGARAIDTARRPGRRRSAPPSWRR